jgi:type II secretory pathway component PulJ
MTAKNTTEKNTSAGFTIIEMVVSVGIFSMVFVSVSGAFISVMDAYQKVTTTRTNVDNLTTAMESMTRGIKTGTNYHCGNGDFTVAQDCLSGQTFAFKNINITQRQFGTINDPIVYRLSGGRIERSDAGGTAGTFYPITVAPPALTINSFSFYVVGSTPYTDTTPDVLQPRVTIMVKGTVGVKQNITVPFSLQTSISQRLLDISD